MGKILTPKFFNQPTLKVAKNLLGKFLVRRFGGTPASPKESALMIIEVEAYGGPEDKASHASRGKTERNKIMFGEAGRWYVYFTYGMHWMLNIVAGPKDYPAAVLIRGAREIKRLPRINRKKGCELRLNRAKGDAVRKIKGITEKFDTVWCGGPARITKYLKIDKRFNGLKADKESGLWIEDRGIKVKPSTIKSGKRIGVDYAGKWADKLYRFKINE